MYIDPTSYRLSDNFLLSDFMGCHSVYKGFANKISKYETDKLQEGAYLCESLLEPILEDYGPFSISYGFISPELSRQIVKYQDPEKPSFHRWDKGAACDLRINWFQDTAPLKIAADLHELFNEKEGYARMITYSESEFLCVASSLNKSVGDQQYLYENRYQSEPKRKPLHKKWTTRRLDRAKEMRKVELGDWRGQGYPSYHGGGILQSHHIRLGKTKKVLSDFLYARDHVHNGWKNLDHPNSSQVRNLVRAAQFVDWIEAVIDNRVSIVKGLCFGDPLRSFEQNFVLELVPHNMSLEDLVDLIRYSNYPQELKSISLCSPGRVRVVSND